MSPVEPINRVPEPTLADWIVKLLTTGMGETIVDFIVKRFLPEIVVVVALAFLLVALVPPFRARRHAPTTYCPRR